MTARTFDDIRLTISLTISECSLIPGTATSLCQFFLADFVTSGCNTSPCKICANSTANTAREFLMKINLPGNRLFSLPHFMCPIYTSTTEIKKFAVNNSSEILLHFFAVATFTRYQRKTSKTETKNYTRALQKLSSRATQIRSSLWRIKRSLDKTRRVPSRVTLFVLAKCIDNGNDCRYQPNAIQRF